jgi:predicted hydrocarbon binding protein
MVSREKDVMVYHYDPKRKFYLVTLQLENKPGALGNLTNILGVRGINILEGHFGGIKENGYGTVSFFIESTNARMDRNFVQELLESAVGVSDVEVKESVEGFLADSVNFPLSWNSGERAVVVRSHNMLVMFDTIRREAGPNGNDIIYKGGFEYGKTLWESILTMFRPKTKEGLAEMLHVYNAIGWGRMELQLLDEDRCSATIRMTEGFECHGVKSDMPKSDFIRGHLSGAMSAYFGTVVTAKETSCVSRGDKYCEFYFTPLPA